MPLPSGTRIGPYEVGSHLGQGGMGVIFRARDTKLERDVALKVLPDHLAGDRDHLSRLQREAQVLASLNHPNIAQVYGFEQSKNTHCIVMELVEGPTLADRLKQGAIPIDEALPVARQIAAALEAAHEHGIVHRDLKPANIKLSADGTVKVLDFGLAKAVGAETSSPSLSNSPTASILATKAGVILGTAAYMSPEQARGKHVDKRTDIFSFGCVLYEMLAGHRAFDGEDITEILGRIVTAEPNWDLLPIGLPMRVRELLGRCLQKNPKLRLRDIGDAQFGLRDVEPPESRKAALDGTVSHSIHVTERGPAWVWRLRSATFGIVALVLSVVTGAAVWLATRPGPPRVIRTMIPPTATAVGLDDWDCHVVITRDGTRVVYVSRSQGPSSVLVQSLDALEPQSISGLVGPGSTVHSPFLSPDGRWLGFFEGGIGLKKVALTGGSPVRMGEVDGQPRGASWGPDDTIVFATSSVTTGLQRMPASGGSATVLTTPNADRGEGDHIFPHVLPDGGAVLFTIVPSSGDLGRAQVAMLDLKTGKQTILIQGGSDARYLDSGYLVYVSGGGLRAVRFDLSRREVQSPSVSVLPRLFTTSLGAGNFSVARDGTLVYVDAPGAITPAAYTLVWVDRAGKETAIDAPPRAYVYPRVSPDGSLLALHLTDQEVDLWLWNVARSTLTRLTFDPGFDTYPVWLPDSRRLIFSSDRAGARNLFIQDVVAVGTIQQLTRSRNRQHGTSISPDGTRLVFTETAPSTGEDVMQLRLDETHQVTPLLQTTFTERNGEVSPDGRWLTYEANDSGRLEVYVRPFPGVTQGRWQVSTTGGTRPMWARNGRELFYLAPNGDLMRVGVNSGSTWTATTPVTLFTGGRYFSGTSALSGRTYDMSSDGRFLMIKGVPTNNEPFLMIKPTTTDASSAAPQIVVVQNWLEEVKRLMQRN